MPLPLALALPAVGGVIAGGLSYLGSKATNRANRDLAREQMAFQERMSSTAYQRATEDMRLSGINPMLAYMKGGASGPGGQTAKMENVVAPALSSALHLKRMTAELRLLDAQTRDTQSADWLKRDQSNLLKTQNLNASHGVTDGSTPSWIARRNRLSALLIDEQLRAVRYSPFMSRFTGTERMNRFRLRPELGILGRPQGRAGQR